MRYEPDESVFPWRESKWVRIQTTFGTYAQKVLIETTPTPQLHNFVKITDATGKEVPISSITVSQYSLYGRIFSYFDLGRSWEINTVSINFLSLKPHKSSLLPPPRVITTKSISVVSGHKSYLFKVSIICFGHSDP